MLPKITANLLVTACLLGLSLASVDGLFWPRMVPYYYPLPTPSSSNGLHSSSQYMYDWNNYNNNFPSSSVLYPSQEQSSFLPPTTGSSPLSGLSRLFQKPWLNWKLAKFGLRSPSSSPCMSGSSTGSPTMGSLFPSLSSLASGSTSAANPPCTTKTAVCCNTGISGSSRPGYVQTNVNYMPSPSSSAYDRHHSQIHYPSNYHYSPTSYNSGSSLTPQATEQTYEFASS